MTLKFDETKHGYTSLLEAQFYFLSCKQAPTQSTDKYADDMMGWVDTIESHGESVSANYKSVPATAPDGAERTIEQREELSRNATLGAALIRFRIHPDTER